MKKYFLLLFLAVFSLSGKLFAQNDTFSFVFTNLPMQHIFTEGKSESNPFGPTTTIDTIWKYKLSGTFTSDSLYRNNGSIIFLNKKSSDSLITSYNKIAMTFSLLSYHRKYYTVEMYGNATIQKWFATNFLLSSVTISDKNGYLTGVIQGDSLSHKGTYTYGENNVLSGPMGSNSSENWTLLQNFTDSTSLSFSITNHDILGVPLSQSIAEVLLYPNPASDFVHIQLPDMNMKEITITDLLGRSVLQSKGDTDLDITALPPGIYYVQCPGMSKVEKLVVRR